MAAYRNLIRNAEEWSWTRRGWVAAAIGLVALTACSPAAQQRPPRLLFICEAGTVKSAIAREMLRRRARERGIAIDVFSRGLVIENHLTPQLLRRLTTDGINPRADPVSVISADDMAAATVVVAFHALPDQLRRPGVVDWSDLGSFNDNYAPTYADLSRRIDGLLDRLVSSGIARTRQT